MSPLIRKAVISLAAVAVPLGMAAAFVFAAPGAAAATLASASRPAIANQMTAGQRAMTYQTAQVRPDRRRRHHHHHHHRRHTRPARLRAYRWAARRAGHTYTWGGTGPAFDCSGLVMMAYRHAGVRLPRTTTGMLASPLLVRVVHPRMGDLAFYGSGHVELFRRWGYTFGAHDSDLPVSLIHYSQYWHPTAFYRVK